MLKIHPDPLSCRNVLAKIPSNPAPFTSGERGTGNWDVTIPMRYLSGMTLRPVILFLTWPEDARLGIESVS